jgi:hypothetical protein
MGILTTFMALGLFIGTILLLRTVFPTVPRKRKAALRVEAVAVEPDTDAGLDADPTMDMDAIAAAVSAAVYVQSMLAAAPEDGTMTAMEAGFAYQNYRPHRKGLGARLEQPRGRWWQPMSDEQGK